MADYDRIQRQQTLREAEGFLELASVEESFCCGGTQRRDQLALRALDLLSRGRFIGRSMAHALYLRGQAFRTMERYGEAVEPLQQAGGLDRRNIHIWLALGWCYKRTGRLDMAIQSLEAALEWESGEAVIHYNLACYWSLAGNRKLALVYLAQAFELDPALREHVRTESDFDPIRKDPDFRALTSVIV
jgi:tetratricopeptide (TPR) repeat protein